MNDRGQTPSQTVGPFFHDGLMQLEVTDLDADGDAGAPIVITGSVLDGDRVPVSDAMLEVWQPDGRGRFRHPADPRASDVPSSFVGFGRVATGDDGSFRLSTAMPGTVPGVDGQVQAPHLNVHVFARGLLDQLWTRIYFEHHPVNDDDPLLAQVPTDRRATLVARADGTEDDAARYRFDVVLQGEGETVFLAT